MSTDKENSKNKEKEAHISSCNLENKNNINGSIPASLEVIQ